MTQNETDKLQIMFNDKFRESKGGWQSFLTRNGLTTSNPFPIGSVRGYGHAVGNFDKVVLDCPSGERYLFIPPDFANRALVLGFLPD